MLGPHDAASEEARKGGGLLTMDEICHFRITWGSSSRKMLRFPSPKSIGGYRRSSTRSSRPSTRFVSKAKPEHDEKNVFHRLRNLHNTMCKTRNLRCILLITTPCNPHIALSVVRHRPYGLNAHLRHQATYHGRLSSIRQQVWCTWTHNDQGCLSSKNGSLGKTTGNTRTSQCFVRLLE